MEYVQRELPYVRSFVLRSVYGVLRQEGITFGEEEPGRVIAEWREDGTDVSLSITAEEKAFGTELTVSLRRPCDGMSKQKVARSMQEMLDQPDDGFLRRIAGDAVLQTEKNSGREIRLKDKTKPAKAPAGGLHANPAARPGVASVVLQKGYPFFMLWSSPKHKEL